MDKTPLRHLLIASTLLLTTASALAGGALDTTFGGTGKVVTPIGNSYDSARWIMQQADGQLVAAGTSFNSGYFYAFSLARYNLNGSLDTTFDGDGKITTSPISTSKNAYAHAIVQQDDGKLITAGFGNNVNDDDFILVRHNADGTPDTSFDGDGKLTTAIGNSTDQAHALIKQTDGKLLAAGRSYNGSNFDIAIARYNSNGTLDTSFDGDGKLMASLGSGDDLALAAIQQADGKIVVAGHSYNSTSGDDFALVRYNIDGSLDITFDGDGKLTTSFTGSSTDRAYALIMQSDGKLVAAGHSGSDIALARYNSDGSLDTTFDGDGKLITPLTASSDYANGVIQQSDGKIVICGHTYAGYDAILARYNNDGSLDNSFGNNGKRILDINNSTDYTFALKQQGDGKLVIAGQSNNDFLLMRVHADFFDGDSDTVDDSTDNCIGTANTDQINTDNDRYGNACDSDDDNDGLSDSQEATLGTDPLDTDTDNDLDSDFYDAFPLDPAEWDDADSDGTGNNADTNDDNDGLSDVEEIALGSDPLNTDSDFDGIADGTDNCLLLKNSAQANADTDALGNSCDNDDDNDGVPDNADQFPLDPLQSGDFDHDGQDNFVDSDDDNDGVPDSSDTFPYDRFESVDSDNDDMPDNWEVHWSLNPNDPADANWDNDADTLNNLTEYQTGLIPQEQDSDGDNINDGVDAYPTDIHHAYDDDNDGMPDGWEAANGLSNSDPNNGSYDEDNDGLSNLDEFKAGTYPHANTYPPNTTDFDSDGVLDGDDFWPTDKRYALDSDNDGLPDVYEEAQPPLDKNNSADASFNFDGDTLSNAQEFALGTNPQTSDSDSDGLHDSTDPWPTNANYNSDNDSDSLPDAWETTHGLNPNNASDANDPWISDNDLLTPLQEFGLGTDPQVNNTDMDDADDRHDIDPTQAHVAEIDTDFDGMPAWWENVINNSTYCPMSDFNALDGFADCDGDGATNLQEFQRDTWPDIAQDRDDDNDGMPNGWEAAHGLQPTDPYDGSYDQDADGLTNIEEFEAGTDPLLADSDRDGVMDGDDHWPADAQYALDSDNDGLPDTYEDAHPPLDKNNSSDASFNFDGDTLSNLQEFALGATPHVSDSDGDGLMDGMDPWPTNASYNSDNDKDGLPDAWELAHGRNPDSASDANDLMYGDGDLLSPLQEFALGTDPQNTDTDGDGFDDRHDVDPLHAHLYGEEDKDFDGIPAWWEQLFHYSSCSTDDWNAFDGFADCDGDGVTNLQEYQRGTWPDIVQDRDDDNDGMPNGWEAAHGLQPTDPYDGSYDQDADGLTNIEEFEAGTDPLLTDSDRDGVMDGDDHWPADAQYALDSDNDGLPDAYEEAHPPLDKNNSSDASFNFDGDTLSNLQEFALSANPHVSDSDGDGLMDGVDPWPTNTNYNSDNDHDGLPDSWEIAHGLNPNNASDANDPWIGDNDLLTPLQEFALGTDPQSDDTDGDYQDDRHDIDPAISHLYGDEDTDFDGMPMWWESLHWNPCSTDDSNAFDGFADCDGDGVTNLQEFTFDINPSLTDSDGDGIGDYDEIFLEHTNPAAADTDGDGVNDAQDKFPLDATDWADYDLDGLGNNADPDDDNDGWLDDDDSFPFDPNQHDGNAVYPLDGLFRGSSIRESSFFPQ